LTDYVYRISFYVTANPGYARAAIYDDSGTNSPYTLRVASVGEVAVSASGWYSIDIPITLLPAGNYWLAVMTRATVIGTDIGPMVNMDSPGTGYRRGMGSTWGPCPATFGGYTYSSNFEIYARYCTQ
jgi:hypothetical protein